MNKTVRTGATMALFLYTALAGATELSNLANGALCGNASPDPGEECDDGNQIDGDGCSATCQIESGLYFCTAALPADEVINLIPDGSFENLNQDGDWSQISHSLFGSLICDDGCIGSPLASDLDGNIVSGNYVLVSGGSLTQASTGIVEHSPVVIPAQASTLTFHYGFGTTGDVCPAPDDGLLLFIDEQLVWSSPAPGATCTAVALYQLVDVDISGFADDQPHVIRFEGTSSITSQNNDLLNIFLDQVRLFTPSPDPQPAVPSQCFLIACGDGIQTPSEQCDDGNVDDGDGCSATCEIEQPDFVCEDGQLPAANTNLIKNPDFEAGDDGAWDFAGPEDTLCSQALCEQNNPLSDAFYAWFRGPTGNQARAIGQSIMIPVTADTLVFDLEVGVCDDPSATLSVSIGNADNVFTADCSTELPDNKVVIDLSPFADGNQRLISLRHTASGESNFFVDNVRLSANTPFAGEPSACTALAEACTTTETFDAGIPPDWTIVNLGPDPTAGWGTSDDGVCGSNNWSGGNLTGGGGAAACADSDAAAQALETYLCTPPLLLTDIMQPRLSFLANYQARSNAADSVDSLAVLVGTPAPSPTTLANYVAVDTIIDHLDDHNLTLSPAGLANVNLTAFVPDAEVHACFAYQGTQAWFAQIDNVAVRSSMCDGPADQDGDGVPDTVDNCTLLPNTSQLDTDGDGHGNACDTDFNDDCIVNFEDLGIFRTLFFGNANEGDVNGDGNTGFIDLGFLRLFFFGEPGPSANGICTPPGD